MMYVQGMWPHMHKEERKKHIYGHKIENRGMHVNVYIYTCTPKGAGWCTCGTCTFGTAAQVHVHMHTLLD